MDITSYCSQVIVKLENYESAHKITYIYEKKIGVQKNDDMMNFVVRKCYEPFTKNVLITQRRKFVLLAPQVLQKVCLYVMRTPKKIAFYMIFILLKIFFIY